MDKLKLILERGYFPVQLPPSFTTASLAKKHKPVGSVWSTMRKLPRIQYERFSVARSSYHRRGTSILNPVSYYFLAHAVATHWASIQQHYSKSRFSFSRPKMERGLRAIRINRFNDVHDHRILVSAGYRYALITDISRFFPTIYTHSIPWALHGKEVSKAHKEQTPQYFGNILDNRSMGVQDFQTLGLPIGPDSSHVIAEIVGVAIDVKLREAFGYWPTGFRYVDDFYLFFNSRPEAERALTTVSRAMSELELQINATKTRIVETKELIEESWKYKLKGTTLGSKRSEQRTDIHRFFENLLSLEKSYRDESVVKYGLRILSSHIIKQSNWKTFEAYLLHCGFAYPNSLQVIASILTTYHKYAYPLDLKSIGRFCNAMVATHAPSDNHSEVTWALWIMIELGLSLTDEAVQAINEVSGSVCVLLALELLQRTNSRLQLDAGKLKASATASALYGPSWLLAYEGGRRGWLPGASTRHIVGDPYFSKLLANDVSFFDPARRLDAIFSSRSKRLSVANLFDSDTDVERYFEFDEGDEEYFDGSGARGGDDHDDGNDSEPEWAEVLGRPPTSYPSWATKLFESSETGAASEDDQSSDDDESSDVLF